jgi:hypothetical protein
MQSSEKSDGREKKRKPGPWDITWRFFAFLGVLGILGLLISAPEVLFRNSRTHVGTEATNEAQNLVNAVKAYEMDYSKYPLRESGDYVELETDEEFMGILLGANVGLNPRGSVYYEGKSAREGVNGLIYSEKGVRLVDPWGRMYRVVIDADYNGELTEPTGNKLRMGVIAYSLGKDGVFGKKSPKTW